VWAAALVIAVAMAGAGSVLIATGIRRFTHVKPMPERTIESLKENLEWMKQPTK
jgi:Putative Actinobacterial Holin-X, holin superfamily III